MSKMKDIPNYTGLYMACESGEIYSLLTSRFLKPYTKSRYRTVVLSKNGRSKTFNVHRLVALTYLPKPMFEKAQVNHINGDKHDNHATNLEWCNGSQNMLHAYRTGLQSTSNIQKSAVSDYCKNNYSKKVIQLDLDNAIVMQFVSASEAARQTGFKQTHISSCCRGKVKTCHNYKFKYA